MGVISVKVPGKVMISGEYAVLYGGTAILLPVPKYMIVSENYEPSDTDYSPVVKSALSYLIPELEEYESKYPLSGVLLDNSEFFHTDSDGKTVKLGLGSSAAEAVGVIALRYERAGKSWDDHYECIAKTAIEVHHKAQGGKGSGADVAACAYRRPIKFRKTANGFEVETLNLKKSKLEGKISLAWTGKPANTRVMVTKFEKWFAKAPIEDKFLFADLMQKSHTIADGFSKTSLKSLIKNLEDYIVVLHQIAEKAGFEYMLPIHIEVFDWANSKGGFAKPTGAGGGDMILLLGDLPSDSFDYTLKCEL
ncbi:MAG: hypothetical protein P9L92_06045 [Candidatus Electryonea clarkiae]|nr:hypothetical protein [Candidatus Electryonea clarkiae]MDP8288801.1 hypothetical protein [Candidatus Electryonea clarkiae]